MHTAKNMATLSKSEYMMYLKHPAWLWLKKHDKSKLPEIDEATQAKFDAGYEFEKYVEQLFPNAIKLGFSNFNEYSSLPKRTQEALLNKTPTIFQGRFEADNITCIVDILNKVANNTYDLIEVKSSTKVKDEHISDLAFQVVVLEASGLIVKNIFVAHVNNKYIRSGAIDPNELVNREDVTTRVLDLIDQTKINISKALEVIDRDTMPDPSPRFVNPEADSETFNEWVGIYKKLLPANVDKYSIYELASLGPKLVAELEDLHISKISDIPDDLELNKRQALQVEVTKNNRPTIDKNSITDFLHSIQFPLYFLDYETVSGPVPFYNGTRPYQQVPFQYSLHILNSPTEKVEHKEYLHVDSNNPIEPLLCQLKNDIGKHGTILTWHMSFEKGRNTEMGKAFPLYEGFMDDINMRIVDLKEPFSKGWYFDKDFLGSASIKNVLPVLSDRSYKSLSIQNGSMAQIQWMNAFLKGKETNKDQLIIDLKKYCHEDTYAMYEIYNFLRQLCKENVQFEGAKESVTQRLTR